jgi:hypothetical protein
MADARKKPVRILAGLSGRVEAYKRTDYPPRYEQRKYQYVLDAER